MASSVDGNASRHLVIIEERGRQVQLSREFRRSSLEGGRLEHVLLVPTYGPIVTSLHPIVPYPFYTHVLEFRFGEVRAADSE